MSLFRILFALFSAAPAAYLPPLFCQCPCCVATVGVFERPGWQMGYARMMPGLYDRPRPLVFITLCGCSVSFVTRYHFDMDNNNTCYTIIPTTVTVSAHMNVAEQHCTRKSY
jgi:hypothetical protein